MKLSMKLHAVTIMPHRRSLPLHNQEPPHRRSQVLHHQDPWFVDATWILGFWPKSSASWKFGVPTWFFKNANLLPRQEASGRIAFSIAYFWQVKCSQTWNQDWHGHISSGVLESFRDGRYRAGLLMQGCLMKESSGLVVVEFRFVTAKVLKLQLHGTGDACAYSKENRVENSDQIHKMAHIRFMQPRHSTSSFSKISRSRS